MISEATRADLPRLVEMGRRFHSAAGETDEFEGEAWQAFCESVMDAPDGLALVSPAGFLIAVRIRVPWSSTATQVHEMFWWSEDGQGAALLRGMEAWGGPGRYHMTFRENMRGRAIQRLCEGLGYERTEGGLSKCV